MAEADRPVLIGVGQASCGTRAATVAGPTSPQDLRRAAGQAALTDTGAGATVAQAIDAVIVVRTMLDSVPGAPQPFGRCANPPGTLAADLDLAPTLNVYSVVGGDQPQALVAEAADLAVSGRARAVLIAGAEATASMRQALKERTKLDWSRSVEGDFEDRGLGSSLLSEHERRHGWGAPVDTYPVFEHAIRTRLGLSRDAYRVLTAKLWSGFSEVAATHPHAAFPIPRRPDFLAAESRENYRLADPYLKWDVAQDAVDQGAAVIVTTAVQAAALGVPEARWVYLHGHAAAEDAHVIDRPDLSRSRIIEATLSRALASAGATPADIRHWDIYSCFPSVVLLAMEVLGFDPDGPARTVTGGLPFFGGPGNNYSLHAIATLAERLRAEPNAFGAVLANGGYISKAAVGVYSTRPGPAWTPGRGKLTPDPTKGPELAAAPTEAEVVAYSIGWAKGQPVKAWVLGQTHDGRRVLGRLPSGHRAAARALADADPIGHKLRFVPDGERTLIDLPPPWAAPVPALPRRFGHVLVERRGPVLEVTINRPDVMNALHSVAHYELHEVFDLYEADRDLWVAILTGAGGRAFSAGNDLKATAGGGDTGWAKSGFAGLTERFDRSKPVIAAVEGIAYGGGLEIVLACDLAVAGTGARFALPEVKVGLFAAAGGVPRLVRQIGRKAALEMMLTGRTVEADEALRFGLVNEVVEMGGALDAARALAERITAVSPSSVRATLQALGASDRARSVEEALQANKDILRWLLKTKDLAEGVRAFAEKRAPKWENR